MFSDTQQSSAGGGMAAVKKKQLVSRRPRHVMSLTDSVIHIQRTYRAFVAQRSYQMGKNTTMAEDKTDSPYAANTSTIEENKH